MADQVRACTFFGHRDAPEEIRKTLQMVLRRIIKEEEILTFYIGNQGKFDAMVKSELIRLKQEYREICIIIVFAYFPQINSEAEVESVYPEGIVAIPKRFCISWRNKWMIRRSELVVTYVSRFFGGASQFADYARKQGKRVMNLVDIRKQPVD